MRSPEAMVAGSVEAVAQIADRIEEAVDVQHKGHQHAGADLLAQHSCPAQPDRQCQGEGAQKVDRREETSCQVGRL